MNLRTFDFATWQMKIRLQADAFQQLDEMVTNPAVRGKHLDYNYPISKSSQAKNGIFTGTELLRAANEGAIISAHDVYLHQMVVVIGSLIETICLEHLELLFAYKPDRMINYIQPDGPNKTLGLVNFREILIHSKESLISTLANRSAKRIVDMPYIKRFAKIGELSKNAIPEALSSVLCEIIGLRNKIVHENNNDKISQNQLYLYFHCTEDFSEWCAHRLANDGVPVRWDNN